MKEAFIVDGVRTPMGKRNGVFKNKRADELGARVVVELLRRNALDSSLVEDIVFGCVTQIGEQGFNITRQIALIANIGIDSPGTSVNRLCGSGLQAVTFAYTWVKSGMMDIVIGGGTESMTRVPMGSDGGQPHPDLTERFNLIPQGLSAELVAERFGITRQELDEFSYQSHMKAWNATQKGYFKDEILPIEVEIDGVKKLVEIDETIRPNTTIEALAKLPPAFKPDGGVITAGSSSQITDGAAALLIASEDACKKYNLKPRAKIIQTCVAGVDPTIMLTGPIPATRKVLKKTGLKLDDISLIEINEAFASVPIGCGKELGFDMNKVNVNGGAVALGHPLGATGARLTVSIINEMKRRGVKYGLVTLCIGFGQGIATIIEIL